MKFQVCTGKCVETLDCTHFADHNRNALVAEHGLQFTEGLGNLLGGAQCLIVDRLGINVPAHVMSLVGGAGHVVVVIILGAPVFISSHQGVLIGVVVDFCHDVAGACGVGGHIAAQERSLVNFGAWGLHDYDTGGVVAAGSAYGA